jgi:hypothetical protein
MHFLKVLSLEFIESGFSSSLPCPLLYELDFLSESRSGMMDSDAQSKGRNLPGNPDPCKI